MCPKWVKNALLLFEVTNVPKTGQKRNFSTTVVVKCDLPKWPKNALFGV